MQFDWKNVGLRIKEERLRRNLTIERLSELIDVSPSFIALIEKGSSGISVEKLCKFADLFKVSIDYLVYGLNSVWDHPTVNKLNELNAIIYDYSEEELGFVIELVKFLRPRMNIK